MNKDKHTKESNARKTLLIDAHVHIYPKFDLKRAVRSSLKNSDALQCSRKVHNRATKIWLLTERSDCRFFQNLCNGAAAGLDASPTHNAEACLIKENGTQGAAITVFAGRQIISSDNLEVCALVTTFDQSDKKLDTINLIKAVREAGGLAALNWAPGKWFGERGAVVKKVLDTFAPDELFISDTTMRPTVWRTPKLMAFAKQQGFRVLSGSDPLPFAGEEDKISSYASLTSGEYEKQKPAESLKAILNDTSTKLIACGHRSGPWSFLQRQLKIMNEKER